MPEAILKETAPALRRASKILDVIAGSGETASISELARCLHLPKSSVHGLCSAMVDIGLLVRLDGNRFRIGPHVMQWASGFLGQLDVVSEFNDLVAGATGLAEYTITLSTLEGADVVYLACRNSQAPLGVTFRTGMHLPAVFTATGKAMLATRTDDDIRQYFSQLAGFKWPQPLTRNSVSSLEALIEEAAHTRTRGFSLDNGQLREGMYCFGSAVKDNDNRVVAGIAVSVLASKINDTLVSSAGQTTRSIAARLSTRLGHLSRGET